MPGPVSSTLNQRRIAVHLWREMRTSPPFGMASSALPIRFANPRSMRLRSSGSSISGGIESEIVTPCASAADGSDSHAADATSRRRQSSGGGALSARKIEQILQQLLNAPRRAIDIRRQALHVAGGRSASTIISAPP